MLDSELPDFFDEVYLLESYYRVPVDKRLSETESGNYFRQLRSFPFAVVSEAAARCPQAYPSFFPKAGEWRMICEQVQAEFRFTRKEQSEALLQADFQKMSHCAHEFVEEIEPPDTFFIKFDVCIYCGLAKPTINRSEKFRKAAAYMAEGIKGLSKNAVNAAA